MEAVGQLTGGVAHDFNNLLMVIGGSLELLRRRTPDTPAVTRLLDAASQGVARGGSLNQQLLAFARKQDLREEVFCVNANADSFMQLVERAAREDIEVRRELAPDLWHCRTDPHQLETAVLNLSINARDAMPSGGAQWDAQPGDYVAVCVSDTGVGMSPEVVSRVFEPFFTTKEVGRGTGLGLSQVYGFAKQSGGFVSISSEVGRGARVCINLKRAHASEAPPPAGPGRRRAAGGDASILVVEDDAGVRAVSSELLGELGYRVTEAATGVEALERLERERFDLVFSDVILPEGVSGMDVACAVAARWPHTAVLLTSGYTAQQLQSDLSPQPALLTKPYDGDQLATAVRAALQGRAVRPAGGS